MQKQLSNNEIGRSALGEKSMAIFTNNWMQAIGQNNFISKIIEVSPFLIYINKT